jgi:hypothetical protein
MLYNWRFTQGNWEGSGYDVLAISPTFPNQVGWHNQAQTVPWWGIGEGQLQVRYQDTSQDFWALVATHLPIAIMSFSRGADNKSWVLEEWARNLKQADWVVSQTWFTNAGVQQTQGYAPPHAGGSAQDFSPYKNQGVLQPDLPPDKSRPAHSRSR